MGSEGAASVALAFQGVSPLYQGYFSTEEWVSGLGKGLGACFDGTVEVVVSYDTENRIGRILVQTGLADLKCRPAVGPEGIDVSPLIPLGQALAGYRDAVSAARDVRVASFRSGIRLVQGGELCDLYIGGQFPPDGTTFSPCVGIRGKEVCAGDRHEGLSTVPFPPGEAGEVLRRCLR